MLINVTLDLRVCHLPRLATKFFSRLEVKMFWVHNYEFILLDLSQAVLVLSSLCPQNLTTCVCFYQRINLAELLFLHIYLLSPYYGPPCVSHIVSAHYIHMEMSSFTAVVPNQTCICQLFRNVPTCALPTQVV